MKIIIGLGNIGKEYERTYHNMGFLTIDKFAERNGFEFSKNKCDAMVAEGHINGEKVILAKPTTYMNNSGISARQLVAKNGCELEDVLVIVDDIDLPLGATRFRHHGSSGTHNGLRSCVKELNSEQFARLRMGVGKPENNQDLADFVLKRIDDERFKILSQSIEEVQQIIDNFVANKLKG